MASRSSSPNPNPNLSKTPKSGARAAQKKVPWANPNPSKKNLSDLLRSPRTEQNENEADPRMNRSRSPAKNFMSPTISAASKRKVLCERNDGAAISALSFETSSDSMESEVFNPVNGGYHRWESPKLIGKYQAEEANPEEFHGDDDGLPPARVSAEEEDREEEEEESRLPPYDPKVNYLSPRPRFLHYKPKPRLELLVHGGGCLQLEEESISSPNSEDMEKEMEEMERFSEAAETTDLEEESAPPRSSSKFRSAAMFVFLLLIAGLIGFAVENPKKIPSLSSSVFVMESTRGKIQDWSALLAASLPEEDLGFFYSPERRAEEDTDEHGVAIDAAEETAGQKDPQVEAADEEKGVEEIAEEEEVEGERDGNEEEEVAADLSSPTKDIVGDVDRREAEAAIISGEVEEKEAETAITSDEIVLVAGEEELNEALPDDALPEEATVPHLHYPSLHTLLGVFSALLALAAMAVALRVKQKHDGVPLGASDPEESCTSETRSHDGRKGRARAARIPEEERKALKRDSIASSSPSYGSFVTFEKLSGKKDGAMTPVRRSSRIRKVASPS